MDEKKTIELPGGDKVVYSTRMNGGMYLDLQDIPDNLAGTRIRYITKALIVSFNGETDKAKIGKAIDEMKIKDLNALATPMIEIMNNPDGDEEGAKKKTDRPLREQHEGQGSGGPANGADGSDTGDGVDVATA